jgi:hypothetical protein
LADRILSRARLQTQVAKYLQAAGQFKRVHRFHKRDEHVMHHVLGGGQIIQKRASRVSNSFCSVRRWRTSPPGCLGGIPEPAVRRLSWFCPADFVFSAHDPITFT